MMKMYCNKGATQPGWHAKKYHCSQLMKTRNANYADTTRVGTKRHGVGRVETIQKQMRDNIIIAKMMSGSLTPFYASSLKQKLFSNVCCSICNRYFPRLNRFTCCHRLVCSECAIHLVDIENDRCCKICLRSARSSIQQHDDQMILSANHRANIIEFNNNRFSCEIRRGVWSDVMYSYPDDIFEIAREYGIEAKAVSEIIGAYPIDDFR